MQEWTIRLYERKFNPNLNSPMKRVGTRMVPSDAIPKKLKPIKFEASSTDGAKRAATAKLESMDRDIASMNFSSDTPKTIIAHVFERKSSKMRKNGK